MSSRVVRRPFTVESAIRWSLDTYRHLTSGHGMSAEEAAEATVQGFRRVFGPFDPPRSMMDEGAQGE